MLLKRRFLLLWCLILVASPSVFATHIVGGELNYRYLGNDRYEIRLKVYRDCFNGIPPFDMPASLGIFDAFNNLVKELPMQFRGSDTIPPTINSPCFIPPTNICYEHTTYIDTVELPPLMQGYQLAYQRCCRNRTILNIITPDQVGATYYATIPAGVFLPNSNPVFTNWPPPFICAGIPFVFDHSATDSDGDSIVYELCIPFEGADTTNSMPQPPNPPPYNSLTWMLPYNLGNLIGGTPMTIDRHTGLLTATPANIGQFVIGVCAHEFRNGIYLSTTKRDFQLNVVACPSYVVAALQNPIINCRTHEVEFENLSHNAGAYLWDFGIPGSTTDTSRAFSPTFVYPDTGVYTVTLIAYSALDPGCADTTTGTVTILPEYEASAAYVIDSCTNTLAFNDTSNLISGYTSAWNWDFFDGNSATTHNPSHTFQPGTHNITLYATSSRGCKDTVDLSVTLPTLLALPAPDIDRISCHNDCDGALTVHPSGGYSPYGFLWSNGTSAANSITALCAGNYSVTVTDAAGCTKTTSAQIINPDTLTVSAIATTAYCHGDCIGTGKAFPAGGYGAYHYTWNDPAQQATALATHLCQGPYTVLVTDGGNCTATAAINVAFSDSLPAVTASADTTVIFKGQTVLLHSQPKGRYSYSWSPSDGLDQTVVAEPHASPLETTVYNLLVTDSNGCSNNDTVRIEVKPVSCTEPEFFIPNAFTPNLDNKSDAFKVQGFTIESLHMSIYDRWGEKVFETNNPSEGWDGTYKGKALAPDVYVYMIDGICWDKQRFKRKGNVTLVR